MSDAARRQGELLAEDDPSGRAAAPEKSPQAFRTISEVAAELDVPAHVLRFWETKFSQISPLKRGGGRRYYRPADVALLKGVRAALYDEGLTIKGLQKLMRERGPRHVAVIGAGEATAAEELAEPPAAEAPALLGVIARLESIRDRLRAG